MKVLIILDVQKAFRDTKGQYEKCLKFIREHSHEYFTLATYSSEYTGDVSDLEFAANRVIYKTGYGIPYLEFAKEYEKLKYIASIFDQTDNPTLDFYIIGNCTEDSVLSTAFMLSDRNEQFKIFTDLVYTSLSEDIDRAAHMILQSNFSANLTTIDKEKNE